MQDRDFDFIIVLLICRRKDEGSYLGYDDPQLALDDDAFPVSTTANPP